MTLTKAYFLGSIVIGLYFFSSIFAMLAHGDYRWNNYLMGVLALGWVPVSLIAVLGFGFVRKPLYCLSAVSYVAYVVINYFTSPKNSFYSEFDPEHIAGVAFGVYFTLFNSWLLYREFRRDPWDGPKSDGEQKF